MLISGGSRHLVIRLQEYSDKKNNNASRRQHSRSRGNTNNTSKDDPEAANMNVETSSNQLTEVVEDHSVLGYLLNCSPCKKVNERHQDKIVSHSVINRSIGKHCLARLGTRQAELGR